MDGLDPIVPMDNFEIPDEDYEPPLQRRRRTPVIRERFNYFSELPEEQFKQRFRLKKTTVQMILGLVVDRIKPTVDRFHAIDALTRLLITLRFLATGFFFICAADNFGVSQTSAHDIVQLVVSALLELRHRYIGFPPSLHLLENVKRKFHGIASFPKTIGAVDCTHVRVQYPGGEEGYLYMNRKGYYSKNVQVIAGPDLQIFNVVTRWPGRFHDMTVFNNSRVRYWFENTDMFKDCVLIGDAGYECRPYLLTPLANPQTDAEANYNESLIRTRNVVERTFGVLKRRFPILSTGIRVSSNHTERIDNYIVACVILHNIAVSERDPEPEDDESRGQEAEHSYADSEEDEVDQSLQDDSGERHARGRNSRLETRNRLIQTYFSAISRT
uniref:Nuclease HARBI1 n=1 Tax=Cacopsylla melanoneura TaxID=428564 RepID=A0A8D8ZAY7_9HEMI